MFLILLFTTKMASSMKSVGLLRHLAVRQMSASATTQKLIKPPLQLYGTEGRYAHALFSAASRTKSLDKVEGELNRLQELLKKDQLLAAFIMNPSINKRDKESVLSKSLKDQKYSDLTINFVGTLADNSRLPEAVGIINAFHSLMRSHRGEVQCTVTTAKALDQANLKDLNTALQRFVKKGEKLSVTTKVDPSLIGGMVVDIGEYHIDMTIAAKIKRISSAMRAAV